MHNHAQTLRLVVLTVNSNSEEVQRLQSALPQESIQWHEVTYAERMQLADAISRFDGVLVHFDGNIDDLDAIAALRARSSLIPIIAYGTGWQVATVVHAMKLGASEVCEFAEGCGELQATLQRCLSSTARQQASFSDVIPKAILCKLTSEEARILHLLVQGRTTKEVGATLDVSIRTVHYRKKELLRKLGVQNRSEAIELIRLSTGNFLPLSNSFQAL